MMKLYEIPLAYQDIHDQLVENGGELTPEIEERLAALDGELRTKAENLGRLVRSLETDALGPREEAKRLLGLAKARESAAHRLKSYLKLTFEALGVGRLETDLFRFRIQNNPPGIAVRDGLDLTTLPQQFVRVTCEVDRDAVLEAARRGDALPDGIELTNGTHLRF